MDPDSRDVAREIANTPRYKRSRRDRKKVEILFAHLKRILKPDRLRLRGLTGAHDEFLAGRDSSEPATNGQEVVRRTTKAAGPRDRSDQRLAPMTDRP